MFNEKTPNCDCSSLLEALSLGLITLEPSETILEFDEDQEKVWYVYVSMKLKFSCDSDFVIEKNGQE